jgi:hypothetical protein
MGSLVHYATHGAEQITGAALTTLGHLCHRSLVPPLSGPDDQETLRGIRSPTFKSASITHGLCALAWTEAKHHKLYPTEGFLRKDAKRIWFDWETGPCTTTAVPGLQGLPMACGVKTQLNSMGKGHAKTIPSSQPYSARLAISRDALFCQALGRTQKGRWPSHGLAQNPHRAMNLAMHLG